MYERMLNKQEKPSLEEMTNYCGECATLFTSFHSFIEDTFQTAPYTQEYIDHKYPCSDGGWIHYRVLRTEYLEDIKKLITVKFQN